MAPADSADTAGGGVDGQGPGRALQQQPIPCPSNFSALEVAQELQAALALTQVGSWVVGDWLVGSWMAPSPPHTQPHHLCLSFHACPPVLEPDVCGPTARPWPRVTPAPH